MPDPRTVVLGLVEEHVDVDSPWIGRRNLRAKCRKDKHPITLEEFDEAYHELREDVEIVTWHGLTTLNDDELLNAILEDHVGKKHSRRVARINKIRAGVYEPSGYGFDGTPEGLPAEDGEKA